MNENSSTKKPKTETKDQNFISKLDELNSTEDKIKFSLEEMKKALSKEDKPDFKTFWEIKNTCLVFFKEPVKSNLKSDFWKEYIELSNEVKNLKSMLNEQSMFEVKQIDLAITSIEGDLKRFSDVLLSMKEIDIDEKMKILKSKKNYYIDTQKGLDLLNAFAARVNSLRKEIIKTQMRISYKNQFLTRLSIIGDIIFPKRKKLIDSISEEFTNTVEDFANDFDLQRVSFFVLKDEIKSLQNLAKKFTLNTGSFTSCRMMLSKCWDKVKLAEKSYKKERQKSKEFIDQALAKIANLKKMCEKDPNDKNIEKEEKEIFNFIKTLSLKNEEIKFLRYKIKEAKAPIYQKVQKEKEVKIVSDNELEEKRKEKINKIKEDILKLLSQDKLSVEELQQEKDQIEKKLQALNLVKFEKLILEKDFRALYHLIEEKKENMTLASSDEVNDLAHVFEQKKQRKQTIKSRLDNLNKQLSCSGLGFEKAMMLRDLIDAEKQRLQALDESIVELEEKIADLESE